MTKKEAVCQFGQIALVVEHQSTQKVVEGEKAVVQVTSKEIYIGEHGNFRIKWKDVSELDIDDEGFSLQSTKHQVQASVPNDKQWGKCRFLLEKLWNKRTEKKEKKDRKEKEQQQRAVKTKPRTYSKRKPRYTFLTKNEGANDWESDDDEIFNRQRPKRTKLEDLENDDKEEGHDETIVEEVDEVTAIEDDHGSLDVDDSTMQAAAEEMDVDQYDDDSSPSAEEEKEEDLPSAEKKVRCVSKPKVRRRLFKKGKQNEDDESDDDDLFNNDRNFTTPHKAQRVVSPAISTGGPNRFDDDDDDGEEEDQADDEDEKQKEEQEEEKSGQQSISRFFHPRKVDTKSTTQNSTKTKQTVTPPTRSDITTGKLVGQSSSFDRETPASDYFRLAGRKPVAMTPIQAIKPSPSKSDESTVLDADTPPSLSMLTDEENKDPDESIVSTPPRQDKKTMYPFSTLKPHKKIEDEDPIEDSPKTPSNSFAKPFLQSAPNRLRKNKQKPNHEWQSTANMALDIADSRSPGGRTPLTQRRSYGTVSQRKQNRRPNTQNSTPPKWRGLRNLGNSCYMNASLQMLFSVPGFVEALESSKDGRRLVSSVSDLWRKQQVPAEYSGVPRPIKKAVDEKTDKFRGYHQRDAHEFLGHLIDQIHEELEAPPKQDEMEATVTTEERPVQEAYEKPPTGAENANPSEELATDRFFRLNVEVCLKCKSCGYARTKEEMYRYLSVDIDDGSLQDGNGKRAVEKCLENFFRPEDREIKCEKCENGRIATQTMRVLSRPSTLLLHLKRFVMVEKRPSENETENNENKTNGFEITFKKNRAEVLLSERLSLKPFLTDSNKDSDGSYKLQSIVYHLGSTADSGHYTSDSARRDRENGGKTTWVTYDDSSTSETSLEKIQESVACRRTAYMLLYNLEP